MQQKRNSLKIKISILGLILVVFGTFIYLFSYMNLFVLDDSTTRCIAYSINKNQEMTCVTEGHNTKVIMFFVGGITVMIIVLGTVLIEYGHKNQKSLTTETNSWFKAEGYK